MTTSGSLLARLKADRQAALLADFPFEFDTLMDSITHVEPVRLASGAPLEPIAKDHGGGTYFLCGEGDGEDRPVLFADSEGSAGVVGTNLRDALLLLIGLPCSGEALHGERQGREMDERALEAMRDEDDADYIEAAEIEDLAGMRAELLDRLDLAPLPPLTWLLERARAAEALDPGHVLINEEGNAYQQG
ncbi:hypothetical protein [Streptomyces coffeae]|uniref:SUKH-4 immunity protein of toxin-antitoxin system n=1 Tax=Streptomyces coffeae TaxID=621382 RepID=A0ABS1NH88_9ACTN|nr:hypothetical protein [Streptomyces coffeae]MBL1099280.1 hypothetical protein [Streptomyces coffeae]